MLSPKEYHYSLETEEKVRLQRVAQDKIKRRIEAALFKARRILSSEEIYKIFPKNKKRDVLKLIRELADDYKEFKTSLEIVELSNLRFQLKVKDPILNSIEKFTQGDLFRKSEIKTLAVIAYLQPSATLKKLYSKRGRSKTVYNNIERLKKLKLIFEKEETIFLTKHFYDYFQIKEENNDIVKNLLKKLM